MHTHRYACMRANKYAQLYLPYALPASMCIKIHQRRHRHMHGKSCVALSSRSPTASASFKGTYVPTSVHPRTQYRMLVGCQLLQRWEGIFLPESSGSSDIQPTAVLPTSTPPRAFPMKPSLLGSAEKRGVFRFWRGG